MHAVQRYVLNSVWLCSSTKLASFPALPVSHTDWYDLSSERNRDPRVAQCIPDGKRPPGDFVADALGSKSARSKRMTRPKADKPRALAFSPYVQDSQTMPSHESETAEQETITEEEGEGISSTFPEDVQLVLKAAESLGMSPSVRLRTIKKLSKFFRNTM